MAPGFRAKSGFSWVLVTTESRHDPRHRPPVICPRPETAAVTGSRGPGAPPASAHSGHPVSEPVPAQMSHAWAVRGRGHAVCENPLLADGASGPRPSISFSCCSRGGAGGGGLCGSSVGPSHLRDASPFFSSLCPLAAPCGTYPSARGVSGDQGTPRTRASLRSWPF